MTSTSAKVALITGAQQGIGHASALALAKQGFDIAAHYFDDEAAAAALARSVADLGRRATIHGANLAVSGAAQALVEDVFAAHGRIDAVVNNAGIFRRARLADLSEELWNATLDVNLRAATFVTKASVAIMRATGTAGSIVNISSVAAFGTARGVHYSASKGGLDAMTRAAALDVARDGIRVNAVAPGMILTAQALEGNDRDELERMAAATVPGRLGSADEVAAVVAFLVSGAASFINGEIIQVNGGAHMA